MSAIPAPDLRNNLAAALPHIAVLVVYAVLEIVLFTTHVPFRDEGQAWFWAQEISPPLSFLIVPGEGHPPLWFWVLRALASVLSFDQARAFTLVLAIINAALLLRLLRWDVLVAALVLFSDIFLDYWGFNFRPYTLIFSLVLLAALAETHGRNRLALWLLAFGCGLQFFAGFLFGFWLLRAFWRGQEWRELLTPALLALFFGLLAVLSGHGNSKSGIDLLELIRFWRVFGAAFSAGFFPAWIGATLGAVLLGFAFRRDPKTLVPLLALALLFSVFSAAIGRHYDWHIAFVVALAVMAYATSTPRPSRWPMFVLLLPGMIGGIALACQSRQMAETPELLAYRAIVSDAGSALSSETNLVSWPDFALLGIAASHDFRYIGGNNGALAGPVNMASRHNRAVDAGVLTTLETPYWLFCFDCETVLPVIESVGREVVELYPPDLSREEPVGAYRIE